MSRIDSSQRSVRSYRALTDDLTGTLQGKAAITIWRERSRPRRSAMTVTEFAEKSEPILNGTPAAQLSILLIEGFTALSRRTVDMLSEVPI